MGASPGLPTRTLVRRGSTQNSLLPKAGLTLEQIDNPEARLKVAAQIRFLELAAAALHDDFLGFHLAQKFDLRELGLFYYVQASSDTLGDALQRGARYSKIVNEGIALKLCDGEHIKINLDYVGVCRRSDRHQIEFCMVTLVRLCRLLTNRRLTTGPVSFTHRRSDDVSEFNSFFGSKVKFGAAEDELVFPSLVSEAAVVGADQYLNKLLIKYCEEAIAARPTNRDPFGLSVEKAIALLLPHGRVRASEVARKLGVSQRTLVRRLAAEGVTFSGVLQGVRSDLANRHLADNSLSISKIAWLLGYQDVSSFTHAVKRWTGKAPRALRKAPN